MRKVARMRKRVRGGMGGGIANDMYNNDVGKESAQKFMKQTDALKASTLYFAS